ncbi:MAG: AI-2E family transporter [Desulfuromonadales bacterium]|nr:AI-2E family transporter [Desulfuromonadales bacterium]
MSIKEHRITPYDIASWVIAGLLLIAIVKFRLLSAVFAGFAVYELVYLLVQLLRLQRLAGKWAKVVAVALLAFAIVVLLTVTTLLTAAFIRGSAAALPNLVASMAEIIETSRSLLPPGLEDNVPQNVEELKLAMAGWLRAHAGDLEIVGAGSIRAVVLILIGIVIGGILSLREVLPRERGIAPLADALTERVERFGDAFRRVVFAQVRIAGINAFLTWLYLGVALPIMGYDLPYTNVLIGVTFMAGLLPVIGNLVSNTVIVVVSLSKSFGLALASLTFLVVIHKLEYFLNAHIIATRIRCKAWELMVAMLVMESVFGFRGLIAAPVFYAYVKDELSSRGLI